SVRVSPPGALQTRCGVPGIWPRWPVSAERRPPASRRCRGPPARGQADPQACSSPWLPSPARCAQPLPPTVWSMLPPAACAEWGLFPISLCWLAAPGAATSAVLEERLRAEDEPAVADQVEALDVEFFRVALHVDDGHAAGADV